MKRLHPSDDWPKTWRESYAYDLQEVYGEIGNHGYAYAYANRRRRTLELIAGTTFRDYVRHTDGKDQNVETHTGQVAKANAENAKPAISADLQIVFIALSNSLFCLFRNEVRSDAITVKSLIDGLLRAAKA